MKKLPTILLTNDDGIYAEGLLKLWEMLVEAADVVVVAPELEKSASSHSITLNEPIRVTRVQKENGFNGYAVRGTPVDCIKVAARSILDKMPDLFISGINHGPNTGISVLYSGTVGAALEGGSMGVTSMAVSINKFRNPDFTGALVYTKKIIDGLFKEPLPKGTVLSVNVPACSINEIQGIRVTHQGQSRFAEVFDCRVDPRKNEYCWLGGGMVEMEEDESADYVALRNGYVSVTPLHVDLTDYKSLARLRELEKSVRID